METIEGTFHAQGCRFGVVVSKFNEFVTNRLLNGTLETLREQGTEEQNIVVVRVPGAFEIPLVARQLARSGRFDAVICVGAVIRGETPHFDYISAETSRGIAQVALDADLPVVFAVLTTNTVQQALDRAGQLDKNRGAEAARTAIEMATLMKQLKSSMPRNSNFF